MVLGVINVMGQYRKYSCISRTLLYQVHTQTLGVRLICEVQVFFDRITNCNHKPSFWLSHINAETSGCCAKQVFQKQNETEMDSLDVYKRQGADKMWQPEVTKPINRDHMGERSFGRHPC